MVNYSNSKIYKLQCNDGHFYIGSTCDELRKRFHAHKAISPKSTSKVYTHINSIGWDNVRIILIEEFECETKDQLRQKEDEYIQKEIKNELCLNVNFAIVNKNKYNTYQKQYVEDHKEELKEYRKQYVEDHKEKYSYETRKEYHRQYYQRKKQQKNNIE